MSDPSENKRIALALLEALPGEIDPGLLSPDLVWWAPRQGEMTLAEFLKNRDDFRRYMRRPSRMVIDGVTAEGDRVAVEARGDGVLTDGRPYRNRYHFLIRVEEGRVVSVREYNDTFYAATIFSDLLG